MDVITLDWVESFWWKDDIGKRLWEKCKLHIAWNAEGEASVSIGSLSLTCINTQQQFSRLVRELIGVDILQEEIVTATQVETWYVLGKADKSAITTTDENGLTNDGMLIAAVVNGHRCGELLEIPEGWMITEQAASEGGVPFYAGNAVCRLNVIPEAGESGKTQYRWAM